MISLTVENARELLEAGETYRLGYNCANCGEMFLCFDRIAQCPQSLEDLERIEDEYKNNPQDHHSPVMLAQFRKDLAGDKLFGFFGFTMELSAPTTMAIVLMSLTASSAVAVVQSHCGF